MSDRLKKKNFFCWNKELQLGNRLWMTVENCMGKNGEMVMGIMGNAHGNAGKW